MGDKPMSKPRRLNKRKVRAKKTELVTKKKSSAKAK